MDDIISTNIKIYQNRTQLYYILSYIYIIDGLIGSIFTLLILYSSFKLFLITKNPHLKICFWILVIDFVLSATIVFMGAIANIRGEYISSSQWFCGLNDVFYIGGYYLSGWFVALMSLERGLLIIHKISIPNWLWYLTMWIETIGFLIVNLIQIFQNQMGLAELGIYCMSTPEYPTGLLTLNWYFVMMCFSLFVTIYSYLGIAIVQRRRAWKDIQELNMSKDQALNQANKIIRKVLLLLSLYLMCNFTEFINTVLELITGETRTALADFISINMLNLNPAINCIILIQFHDKVKIDLVETYPFLINIFGKCDREPENNHFRSVLNGAIH
jgi:hypothetical protein